MVGGYHPQDIDDFVLRAAESVRSSVEQQLGHSPPAYEVLEALTQVVSGTNCKLKVRISDSECVHLLVFVPLPHLRMLPVLKSFSQGLTLSSPLA